MELKTIVNKIENDAIVSISYTIHQNDSLIMMATFSIYYQIAIFCDYIYNGDKTQLTNCTEMIIRELKTHGISMVQFGKTQILI